MKKKVRIDVTAAATIGLPLLNPFQGDLKTLSEEKYDKLKHEIVEDGFSFAFHVWEGPDAKLHILDGHQRLTALLRMKKEGFEVPAVPVNYVKAKNIKQAKRKLLAAAAQYGTFQQEGFKDFLKTAQLDVEEVAQFFTHSEVDLGALLANTADLDDIAAPVVVGAENKPIPTPVPIKKTKGQENDGFPLENRSQVRMVQLFFTTDTQAEFLKMAAKLQAVGKHNNLTDTVMGVTREAYRRLGKTKR